jgi:DNA (cytosine-5)-methyltransferase 1
MARRDSHVPRGIAEIFTSPLLAPIESVDGVASPVPSPHASDPSRVPARLLRSTLRLIPRLPVIGRPLDCLAALHDDVQYDRSCGFAFQTAIACIPMRSVDEIAHRKEFVVRPALQAIEEGRRRFACSQAWKHAREFVSDRLVDLEFRNASTHPHQCPQRLDRPPQVRQDLRLKGLRCLVQNESLGVSKYLAKVVRQKPLPDDQWWCPERKLNQCIGHQCPLGDRVEVAWPCVLGVRQPIADPRSYCEELPFGLGFDVGWIWRQLLDHRWIMVGGTFSENALRTQRFAGALYLLAKRRRPGDLAGGTLIVRRTAMAFWCGESISDNVLRRTISDTVSCNATIVTGRSILFTKNERVTDDMATSARPHSSIEMFTGAGGLALATHMAGFQHAGLFEWNEDACDTLRANARHQATKGLDGWQDRVTEGDVSVVDFRQMAGVDLVAGGPPCQPFSLGGKHQGMGDKRDMIPQFIRAVREAQPRAFIMENVRGLARKSFATYLEYSKLQLSYPEIVPGNNEGWERHFGRLQQHHTSDLRKCGLSYNVLARVLNAADFGVPQCRERLFVVGFRNDINARWRFPDPTHSQDRLLYEQWVTGDYWKRAGVSPSNMSSSIERRVERLDGLLPPDLAPWMTVREAIKNLPAPFKGQDDDGATFNHRFQPGARPYSGHTGSPIDSPSKTLKAGDHGVPGGENMIDFGNGSYRYFTVREAARIQTFPDTWHFKGAWSEAMRQLGNAVPVELAKVVAKSVAKTLATHH